jgi:hypothetical protein
MMNKDFNFYFNIIQCAFMCFHVFRICYLHFCVFHLTVFIHVIASNDATLCSFSRLPVSYTCKTLFLFCQNCQANLFSKLLLASASS